MSTKAPPDSARVGTGLVPVLVVVPTAVDDHRGGDSKPLPVCMTLFVACADFVSDYVPWWEQVIRLAGVIPDGTWQVIWVHGPLGPQDLHKVAERWMERQ